MSLNSRRKGATGELAWARVLTDHGFPARRGQQYSGSPDSPDVVCESLDFLHFEVKRTQRLSLHKAMDQAMDDCGDAMPVIAHKKNHKEWLVILSAEDFISLLGKLSL